MVFFVSCYFFVAIYFFGLSSSRGINGFFAIQRFVDVTEQPKIVRAITNCDILLQLRCSTQGHLYPLGLLKYASILLLIIGE